MLEVFVANVLISAVQAAMIWIGNGGDWPDDFDSVCCMG